MPIPKDTVIDFRGGLASVVSPYSRPVARRLENCWLSPDDIGAVEAMPGFGVIQGSGPSGATQVRDIFVGIDETDFSETIYIAAKRGGSGDSAVYQQSGIGWALLKSGLDLNARLSAAQINNFLCFVNGVDTPFQINMATQAVTDIGLTRPSVTNASTSAGSLTGGKVKGIVKYWISEISGTAPDIVEGPLSASFGQFDAGDGAQVDIDLTHADFTGSYRIYRTLANGSHPFLIINEAAGGSTHLDNVPDEANAESDGATNLPYLHGDPPPDELITIVNDDHGRLWGLTEDGKLYFCDAADHNSWWTSSDGNWLYVGRGDGDRGTALAVAPDGILAFKDHHLYHVYARTLEQIQVTPSTAGGVGKRTVGTVGQWTVASTPSGTAFFHDGDVYVLDGLNPISISKEIEEDLSTTGFSATADDYSLGYSYEHNHLWMGVSNAVAPDSDDSCFIYDIDRGRWIGRFMSYFYSFAETGSQNANTAGFHGAGGIGATNQDDDAWTLYNGTEIPSGGNSTAIMELSPVFGNSPMSDKLWEWVDVLFDRQPDPGDDITLRVIFDSDDSNRIDSTVQMDESGSTQDRIRRRCNLGMRGREMTVTLTSSTLNPQWKVYLVAPAWVEYRSTSRVA